MDTSTTTLSAELREAAAKLRATADRATDGPWRRAADDDLGGDYPPNFVANWDGPYLQGVGEFGDGEQAERDSRWVSLAHPGLAEPLAAWLEETARQYDAAPCDDPTGVCNGCERRDDFVTAQFVAQVINGGAS